MDEEKVAGKEKEGYYGEIYIISNDINKKLYIGQTTRDIKKRFKEHLYEDSAIGNAMRKYGIEHFRVESIEKCYTKEQQNAFEIFWIRELGTLYPEGYNLTIGGEGANDLSGDIRRQISLTKTGRPGRPQTEAEKAKRAATVKAYWESHPEELNALTERMRGNTYAAGHKNFAGHKHTDEAKAKMSAATKAYWERKRAEAAAQENAQRGE
ncbi:MAG: GIY-YIG nuclease family protein [Selenomonadaceae bacterium]|nr:GIY-YIG nuclease family protein [Selenomonadaceae bacterium]